MFRVSGTVYMQYINRSAIVINYKKPFIEWANSLHKNALKLSLNQINQDNIVYLVEEYDDLHHLDEIIKPKFEAIFRDLLKGWCKNKSMWPEKMSWKLFNEWFEINAHSRVKDLESIPFH